MSSLMHVQLNFCGMQQLFAGLIRTSRGAKRPPAAPARGDGVLGHIAQPSLVSTGVLQGKQAYVFGRKLGK